MKPTRTDDRIDSGGYVITVSNLGCSKVVVPYHLKDQQLWIRSTIRPGQQYLSFSISFQDKPNNMGWVAR
jgi:hypothetical protein